MSIQTTMMTESERAQLDENCELTRKIFIAVVGDKDLGAPGLMGAVKRAHDRIDEHEKEDRANFEAVKEGTRKVGKEVQRLIYICIGAFGVLKLAAWIWELLHMMK